MVYIDLNMVRAGVVTHPRHWDVSGYNEILSNTPRYRFIDLSALMAYAQVNTLEALRACYQHWHEEYLAPIRDPHWSSTIAVGQHNFVEQIQSQLKGAARYRNSGVHAFNLLAYNVYMRPTSLFKNGQSIRAGLIPAQVRGYDVLILSEAFDDTVRAKLLNGLRHDYPYHSSVVGRDAGVKQDGGVIIVSKWPIVSQKQMRYHSCDVTGLNCRGCSGSDCHAQKGAVYVKVNKKGKIYHVFGTHTQADSGAKEQAVRGGQLQKLALFIAQQRVPANEPVLIGGDLNVDKISNPTEYRAMLSRLNATHPPQRGHAYSFDPSRNKLASKGRSEYLDYVLYANNHLKPYSSYNEVRLLRSSKEWKEFVFEKALWDLSDHYPVYGHFEFR